MQTISKYDFTNKRALIRVDYNVPLDKATFEITDDTRIRATLPTISKILTGNGSVILMSHLGRPEHGPDPKFSLNHILEHLSSLLGQKVKFADDCIGENTVQLAASLKPGEVLLLENLRFYAEEEGKPRLPESATEEEKKAAKAEMKIKQKEFTKKLAALGDCYVNDAFGTAHRAHASTALIAAHFPNDKMFGYLIENELKSLDKVLTNPQRPLTAIMGGAKISTKITIIENLLSKVDNLILGGGMTFTFILARGGSIGTSLSEPDFVGTAKNIEKVASEKGVKLYLAVDVVAADAFDANANTKVLPANQIPDGWQGLDAGPESIALFKKIIEESGSILWNGPVGVFEFEKFAAGSRAVADAIVAATSNGAFSLIGGGDSVACINKFGLADGVSYISTAGGALLEYLEGIDLPGVAAIRNE